MATVRPMTLADWIDGTTVQDDLKQHARKVQAAVSEMSDKDQVTDETDNPLLNPRNPSSGLPVNRSWVTSWVTNHATSDPETDFCDPGRIRTHDLPFLRIILQEIAVGEQYFQSKMSVTRKLLLQAEIDQEMIRHASGKTPLTRFRIQEIEP